MQWSGGIVRAEPDGTITQRASDSDLVPLPNAQQAPDGTVWVGAMGEEGRALALPSTPPLDLFSAKPGVATALIRALSNSKGAIIALTEDGKRIEKATSGVPINIVVGPMDRLWFTQIGGEQIGVAWLDEDGEIELHEMGEVASPTTMYQTIVAGPEDRIWFAQDDNFVGLVEPAEDVTQSKITEIPVAGKVNTVTVGPRGQTWFGATDCDVPDGVGGTHRVDGCVGVVTRDGEGWAAVEAAASGPVAGIDRATDGSLWFGMPVADEDPGIGVVYPTSSSYCARVGKSTPLEVSEVRTKGPTSHPRRDRVGDMWFVEDDGEGATPPGRIGRAKLKPAAERLGNGNDADKSEWDLGKRPVGAPRITGDSSVYVGTAGQIVARVRRPKPSGYDVQAFAVKTPGATFQVVDNCGYVWSGAMDRKYVTQNALVSISPEGQMQTFPMEGMPVALLVGPDGDIWATLQGNKRANPPVPDYVVRIEPDGSSKTLFEMEGFAFANLIADDRGNILTGVGPASAPVDLSEAETLGEMFDVFTAAGLAATSGRLAIIPANAETLADVRFVETQSPPQGFSRAPDSSIWFGEGANFIGRYRPFGSGTVQEFPTRAPTSLAIVATINRWAFFAQTVAAPTDADADAVGYFIGYAKPKGTAEDQYIAQERPAQHPTRGARGTLWFANNYFPPSKAPPGEQQVAVFGPSGTSLGPVLVDGNPSVAVRTWFGSMVVIPASQAGENSGALVNAALKSTNFTVTQGCENSTCELSSVRGPRGLVWFGEQIEKVAAVNPFGTSQASIVTEVDLGSGFGVTPAVGPDGDIWFGTPYGGQGAQSKIFRISPR